MKVVLAAISLLLLASCGSREPEKPADMALPVVAPFHAGERLRHDVGKQNQLARDRRAKMDEIIDSNR